MNAMTEHNQEDIGHSEVATTTIPFNSQTTMITTSAPPQTNNNSNNTVAASLKQDHDITIDGPIGRLPNELIRHIYSFFDIRSLGTMAQVNKHGILSSLATDGNTWSDLTHRRFQINVQIVRSKSLGGTTWKDAYRSLSYCNRAPKCRFTPSRKVIFAKAGGGRDNKDPLSVWVLLNHTDSCQTRRVRENSSGVVRNPYLQEVVSLDPTTNHRRNNNNARRFVEFNVCLQNVKSSAGPITIDLLSTTLEMAAAAGMGNQSVQVKGMPKMIHRHSTRVSKQNKYTTIDQKMKYNDDDDDGLIVLKPFDFCVVTMSFACGGDVFETDLLARALALRVALLQDVDVNDDETFRSPNEQLSVRQVRASFVPESDVWNYYTELPGGFLSLNDKYRLLNV